MMKKILVALVLAVAVPVGMMTVTRFAFVPAAQAFSIKKVVKRAGRGARNIGRGVRRDAKKVGRGAKTYVKAQGWAAKKFGKAAGRGAKKVGRGVKKYGEAQVWAAKKAGKAIGRGARKVGRKAGKGACYVVRGCTGRIGDPVGPKIRDHRT